MRSIADETLVADVQDGNIGAFEELLRRYQGKLYRFVTRIISEHHAAEDIVQVAFIRLYTSIERVDTSKKFSSYLYALTRNCAISFLRAQKRDVPLEEALTLTSDESPDAHVIAKDERRRVREAVNALDTKYKNVLSLYYFDNLSYEEISKRLKFPLNTVRTHIKRAKEVLRKKLT